MQLARPIRGEVILFTVNYRTLRGQDQRKRCTLNFIKYTLGQTCFIALRVLYVYVKALPRVLYEK